MSSLLVSKIKIYGKYCIYALGRNKKSHFCKRNDFFFIVVEWKIIQFLLPFYFKKRLT